MVEFRRFFLTGLLIFVPLAVTIYVLMAGFQFLDGILRPFILPLLGARYIPGISFLALVVVITGIGAFARFTIGARVVAEFENMLMKIPLIKGIYSTVKYASSAFISDKSGFMGVVLIEYPRKGVYTLGLTTAVGVREIQEKTKEKMINVFIPTSPNPTSGILLMVPEKDVIKLDMSVDDGLRLVISGGFSTIGEDTGGPSKA